MHSHAVLTECSIVNGINKCIRRLARHPLSSHRRYRRTGRTDDAEGNDQIGDRLQTRQCNCKELLNLACTVNLCGLIQRCRDIHQSCIENNEEISDIFPDRRDTYRDQRGAGLSEPVDRTNSKNGKYSIYDTAVCRKQQRKQRSDKADEEITGMNRQAFTKRPYLFWNFIAITAAMIMERIVCIGTVTST